MENPNTKVEMANGQRIRCTWQRTTEMYADLILMPGITVAFLQSIIDNERVFVDDADSDGDGFLYTFGGGGTCSELVLARIVKLDRDSIDDAGSFVLSEEGMDHNSERKIP